MFDRSKIKKIIFISENRKGVVLDDCAFICDEKNKTIKEWKGKNLDLIKVKNQPYVAFVQQIIDPRDPQARRDAVTGQQLFLAGQTELMHVDKLEEPFRIPHAVSEMVLMNNQFFGFSGLRVIVSDLKKWSSHSAGVAYSASNFVSINDCLIMGACRYGGSMAVLHTDEDNAINTSLYTGFKPRKICGLKHNQFLMQNKAGELIVSLISKRPVSLLRKGCKYSV